jgi:hypothetical protein
MSAVKSSRWIAALPHVMAGLVPAIHVLALAASRRGWPDISSSLSIVMAGLVPAIHVFGGAIVQRRGCPA